MNEHDIRKLDQLADLMDNAFIIPGTKIRIGLDAILGLLPGIGDTAALAVAGYIIHKAHKSGVHPVLLMHMAGNVFMDWLVGLVPFVGDIFDVGFKANRRNVDILKEHIRTGDIKAVKKNGVYTV